MRATLTTLALCCAALPGQMSGSYAIDPNQPMAFPSFATAVQALFANGVSGPTELVVAPGLYSESVLIPPIAGASAAATVTFRSAQGPGTVQVQGTVGNTFTLFGLSFARSRGLVFDGLDFVGAPGHAIASSSFVESVEIRNCTFAAGHVSTANGENRDAIIASENAGVEAGWNVHHNVLTLSPWNGRTSLGIYVDNGKEWDIHHNRFELNGGSYGVQLVANNSGEDRIYDNEFVGELHATSLPSHNAVAAIRVDAADFENYIAHNTFAVRIATVGCCVATAGFVSLGVPVQNHLLGNVFVVDGPGTCVVVEGMSAVAQPFVADGNVYHAPLGSLGRIGTGAGSVAYSTLSAWQFRTSQDAASVAVDPLLLAPFATPADVRPAPGSPVVGVAVMTPSYVVDDHAGRLRDDQPDAGAHESTSFAVFGSSCAGTGSSEPRMAHGGSVALGSGTFSLELTQAPPSAAVLLVGGLSRTDWTLGPLPFDLGGGCLLHVSPLATVALQADGAGACTVPYPLPNQPGLAGTDVFFQWLVLDPGSASALGVTASEGGALQL